MNLHELIKLKNMVLNGQDISYHDAIHLVESDLMDLREAANEIRKFYLKDSFDICSIINAKSGSCSEDCKFCAQSSHFNSSEDIYEFLEHKQIEDMAKHNAKKGVLRFSLVTSGKRLEQKDLNKAIKSYKKWSIKQYSQIFFVNNFIIY